MSPLKYIFERGCFLIILKCGMKQEASSFPSNLGEDIAKAATKRADSHQWCASSLSLQSLACAWVGWHRQAAFSQSQLAEGHMCLRAGQGQVGHQTQSGPWLQNSTVSTSLTQTWPRVEWLLTVVRLECLSCYELAVHCCPVLGNVAATDVSYMWIDSLQDRSQNRAPR